MGKLDSNFDEPRKRQQSRISNGRSRILDELGKNTGRFRKIT